MPVMPNSQIPFERVVFTCDLFRIKTTANTTLALQRLEILLTPALRALNLRTAMVADDPWMEPIRRALGMTESPEDWARVYSAEAFPPGVE